MAITKITSVDKIEVVGWNIQCREATQFIEDGQPVSGKSFHRYVLTPDSSLDGQPQRVIDVANGAWDADTRAAFEAHKAEQAAAAEEATDGASDATETPTEA
jgi:phage FluMu gp28-like protein